MNNASRAGFLLVFLFILCGFNFAGAQTPETTATTGKEPVIIIPGITGSELVNSKTGEEVWFKLRRSKDDGLRLPISPDLIRNRDNLVAGDIVRTVKVFKFLPEVEIYERLTEALKTRGGYKEGQWKNPAKDGYQDTYYVFPYDWRRDNVENARLLIRRIEQLKRTLRKPNLKFNIIAHSMGGLIARYAARYGDAELPTGVPKPTWTGAKDLDKIFLLGTPNEGSVSALDSLLNGFSYIGGGLNLPFVQDVTRFDVFTMPSAFQLLPHDGTLLMYDENLKPIDIDIYDPKTWEKYNWCPWQDPGFEKKMSALEQRNAKAYFDVVLNRAKRLQAALDVPGTANATVSYYLMGADCKDTQNAAMLIRDEKKDRWKVIFKPTNITTSTGVKLTEAQLKEVLMSKGDGVVTKRSLMGESSAANGRKPILTPVSELFQCEIHNKLATNQEIQDKLLLLLSNVPAK